MSWTRWPFPDERAFWRWAYDPDAELDDDAEDLMLYHPEGLVLLVAAAADDACPKRDYCANILSDYSHHILRWEHTKDYPALRAAADYAATLTDPRMRDWATLIDRLFIYQHPTGPVDRAAAERMAGDLLGHHPWLYASGYTGWPSLYLTPDAKYWEATGTGDTVLHINRRTGVYRIT